MAQQNHWTERGRATAVANLDVTGRPRRSVLAVGSIRVRMTTQKQAPRALSIVVALFIISGLFAALEVLVSLTRGRINLNFGVLGIFIGLGLLRFRRGWRTCALLFTWIALVFVPVFALLVLGGAHPIRVKLFGQRVGSTSPGTALFIAVAAFAVALWQYRVLTRRDVVQLFNEQAEPGAAPNGGPATWRGNSGGTEGPPSLS